MNMLLSKDLLILFNYFSIKKSDNTPTITLFCLLSPCTLSLPYFLSLYHVRNSLLPLTFSIFHSKIEIKKTLRS